MRACILGPPASGKTLVIKQLCEHYKLHHIKIQDVIDEAVEKLVSTDSISVYDFAVEVSFLANHTVSQRQGKGGLDCGLLIYGKTDKKNLQLALQHFCRMSGKVMLSVLPPTFKPVLQQIRLLQVA